MLKIKTLIVAIAFAFVGENIACSAQETDMRELQQKNLIYALSISKTFFPDEAGTYSMGKSEIQFFNLTLKSVFEMLLEASPLTIELPDDLIKDNIDIYYRPGTNENYMQYREKMFGDICHAMGVEHKTEKRRQNVYKLRCGDCSALQKKYSDMMAKNTKVETKFEEKDGRWKALVAPVTLVTRYLETTYKHVFVDETNLRGYYDFDLSEKNIDAVISDLKKMGIDVVVEEKDIEIHKFVKIK